MASLHKQIIATDDVRVCIYELDPLEEGERHYHSSVIEHPVSLSEGLQVLVEGEAPIVLGPGMICGIPIGKVHRVVNSSSLPARYLLIQGGGTYDFNVVEIPSADPDSSDLSQTENI